MTTLLQNTTLSLRNTLQNFKRKEVSVQLPGPNVSSSNRPSFEIIKDAIEKKEFVSFYDSTGIVAIHILENMKALSYEKISISNSLAEIFFINTCVVKNGYADNYNDQNDIEAMIRVYEREIIDYYQNSYNNLLDSIVTKFFMKICRGSRQLSIHKSIFNVYKEIISLCKSKRNITPHISDFEQIQNKITAMYSISKNELFYSEKELANINVDTNYDNSFIKIHKDEIEECQFVFDELDRYKRLKLISYDTHKKCIINLYLFMLYSYMNVSDNLYFYQYDFFGRKPSGKSIDTESISEYVKFNSIYYSKDININNLPNISKETAIMYDTKINYNLNKINNIDSEGKDLLLAIRFFQRTGMEDSYGECYPSVPDSDYNC